MKSKFNKEVFECPHGRAYFNKRTGSRKCPRCTAMKYDITKMERVTSLYQLLDLAKNGKAVYVRNWDKPKPAAFMVNWQLRLIHQWIEAHRVFVYEHPDKVIFKVRRIQYSAAEILQRATPTVSDAIKALSNFFNNH